MRMRLAALFLVVLAATLAVAGVHRSHWVSSNDHTSITIIREDDDYWAKFERNGVKYFTRDAGVLAQIETALEKHRRVSAAHAELGRRHRELGREHAAHGREHARLGREHSRLSREASRDGSNAADIERRRRALEEEQRGLESQQRALEDRQRGLEEEQRKLETKQRANESEKNRQIEEIFARAAREGKATKK